MKVHYYRRVLSNASKLYGGNKPTIQIVEGTPEWDQAYKNWLQNKTPTDSPEWKLGVFLSFEPHDRLIPIKQQSTTLQNGWSSIITFVALIGTAIAAAVYLFVLFCLVISRF